MPLFLQLHQHSVLSNSLILANPIDENWYIFVVEIRIPLIMNVTHLPGDVLFLIGFSQYFPF